MAMITYDNKSTLNPQPSVADVNKVKAEDMNEIKSVVNANYGEVGDITTLTTTDKTSVVNAINTLTPTTLYNNDSGTTGNIILNDNISNYSFYEIYFSRGTGNDLISASSVKMTTSLITNVSLTLVAYLNNITRIYTANISISGTNLTRNYTRYVNIPNSGTGINGDTEGSVYIYKVLGYK